MGKVSDVTDLARIPAIEVGGAGGGVELLVASACTVTGIDVGDCTGAGEPTEGEALAATAVGYGVGAVGEIVLATVEPVIAVLVVLAALARLDAADKL